MSNQLLKAFLAAAEQDGVSHFKEPMSAIQPASPLPWRLHVTGGYIAVLDACKKPVIRKTTNTLTIDQFRALKANLDFVIAQCNGAPPAQHIGRDHSVACRGESPC